MSQVPGRGILIQREQSVRDTGDLDLGVRSPGCIASQAFWGEVMGDKHPKYMDPDRHEEGNRGSR